MNGINLTSEEKKELEKRGFLVKDWFWAQNLFDLILQFIFLSIIFSAIVFLVAFPFSTLLGDWWINIMAIPVLFTSTYFFRVFSLYIKKWSIFYWREWKILFWEIKKRQKQWILKFMFFSHDFVDGKQSAIQDTSGTRIFRLLSLAIALISIVVWFVIGKLLIVLVLLSLPILAWLGTLLISKIYQSFNPLYAFGNLWERIQSLTPCISEKSKQIERGFRWGMDFRVLSKSFDALASTFSQIVGLVVKLEQVEKNVNKWDLFDSMKYIDSLREDIRTPLLSLKSFLEKKKIELITSEQELSQVRVSVWWESENRELQSVRSQELMKELDESIGKLGVMIEKI